MARKGEISHGKYVVTFKNGVACAAWREADETGAKVRRRVAFKPELRQSTATVGELRAALVAFAAEQNRVELRTRGQMCGDILEAFIRDRVRDGKVEEPMRTNQKALAPFFGRMSPYNVTPDLCRDYTQQRHDAGISPSTILTELTRLSSALNWAVEQRVIDYKPPMWFPQPSQPRDRVLTPDEFDRLLDGCVEKHTRLFCLLLVNTAARKGAILELTWDRIDFEKRTIDLKVQRKVDPLKKKVEKGRGKVYMNDVLLAALVEAKSIAQTNHVIEFEGQPCKYIRTSFEAAVRRAGLGDDVTPHTLRHTALTWSDEEGEDITNTAKLAGHKNSKTTSSVYTHSDVAKTKGPAQAVANKLAKLRVIK